MSGLFKSIGKIFKKVAKVVKKFALPALAIAAVIVTGGAALGLIPAIGGIAITGVGSLAAALGAPAAVATILSTAATGATIGFGTSLLTGGNPIKGATMGFVTGAVAGGIGQLAGGIGGAAGGAAPATAGAATQGSQVIGTLPVTGQTLSVPVAQAASGGIGQAAASGASSAVGSTVASAGRAATGSGILGFIERNPMIASSLMKGIGGAIQGDPRSDELKRRRKSYDGVDFWQPYGVDDPEGQEAGERYDGAVYGSGGFEYDPQSGTVRRKG